MDREANIVQAVLEHYPDIYAGDVFAAEEFEMLTMSNYQKLNEERAGIVAGALADGRFHQI